MSRTRSEHPAPRRLVPLLALLLLAGAATQAAAQQARQLLDVLSSEINVSRDAATLRVELSSGKILEMAMRDGGAYIDGRRIGDAARGSPLDRSWRELLNEGIDASSSRLPALLADWNPPAGDVAARMDQALEVALDAGAVPATADDAAEAAAAPATDSLGRLMERIAELERQVRAAESQAAARPAAPRRPDRPARSTSPFRHITQGLAGIFSLMITYLVLFAIGVAGIFFGGRRYMEGVADTVRHAPGRSLLVGLAGAFLAIIVWPLAAITLGISIIGIPAALIWFLGFPSAVILAWLLGYFAVAHVLGEVLAERRFKGSEWFQRSNSYYFLLTGIGLLLALFFAGNAVHMAGLHAMREVLKYFSIAATVLAVAIGFGAVLLSRAGTRPPGHEPSLDEHDFFAEETRV